MTPVDTEALELCPETPKPTMWEHYIPHDREEWYKNEILLLRERIGAAIKRLAK